MEVLGDKLKRLLVEVCGGDTMTYSLGAIIEAMRRAYLMGHDDANSEYFPGADDRHRGRVLRGGHRHGKRFS